MPTRTRPLVRALAVVALLGALLAGCEDGPDGPRQGGTLRLGITTVGPLDPGQARTVEQLLVADQLFDSLTAYDTKALEAVPSIAARWEASEDQRQWDFFLDDDAEFHNGRRITAADVKWSLERLARPGSGLAGGDLLELVSGYGAFARDGSAGELSGITAPEPHRLHISLDQPLAVLPSVLANPVLAVVPREAVEAVDPRFAERPVGSGPFKVAERSAEGFTLEPARPGAMVERIELVEFADIADSYGAFEAGGLDWSRVPPERVEQAAATHGRDAFVPYAGEILYGFNMRNPKFADSRIRQAVLKALDRRAIVRAVYGDTVRPLDGIVVEGVPGHQADPCGAACRHDPAEARRLLAEARPGQPPLEVNLDFDDDVTQQAIARAIKAALESVGMVAHLRPHGPAAGDDYGRFVLTGQQELFRLGWIAAYPSPDAFLPPLFATGSPSNLTGHSVPAVDEQLRAARAEPDDEKRLGLYRAAERAVMSSLPVIPIAQLEIHGVVSPRVRGLRVSTLGTFDAARVWLAD